MFLYAAALILEFAALIWLRITKPEMARPYRVPFGIAGVIAISVPPIALCFFSIALANKATRYVGLFAIAIGLVVYRYAWYGAWYGVGPSEVADSLEHLCRKGQYYDLKVHFFDPKTYLQDKESAFGQSFQTAKAHTHVLNRDDRGV